MTREKEIKDWYFFLNIQKYHHGNMCLYGNNIQ